MYIKQKMYITYLHMEKPRPNSERIANTKLTTQMSKSGLIKWFGENVSYLILGGDMAQSNLSFLHIVSQEMISHFYVFGSGVEN